MNITKIKTNKSIVKNSDLLKTKCQLIGPFVIVVKFACPVYLIIVLPHLTLRVHFRKFQ